MRAWSLLFRLQCSRLSVKRAQQALILQTSIDSWLLEWQAGFSQNRIIYYSCMFYVFVRTQGFSCDSRHSPAFDSTLFCPCFNLSTLLGAAEHEQQKREESLQVKQNSGSVPETFSREDDEELWCRISQLLLNIRPPESCACCRWGWGSLPAAVCDSGPVRFPPCRPPCSFSLACLLFSQRTWFMNQTKNQTDDPLRIVSAASLRWVASAAN